MADKRPSLAEAIRAAVPPKPGRCRPWWQKISPAHLAEVESIRDEWRAGRLAGTKSGVAKAMAKELNDRGISDVGIQGVIAWLGKR